MCTLRDATHNYHSHAPHTGLLDKYSCQMNTTCFNIQETSQQDPQNTVPQYTGLHIKCESQNNQKKERKFKHAKQSPQRYLRLEMNRLDILMAGLCLEAVFPTHCDKSCMMSPGTSGNQSDTLKLQRMPLLFAATLVAIIRLFRYKQTRCSKLDVGRRNNTTRGTKLFKKIQAEGHFYFEIYWPVFYTPRQTLFRYFIATNLNKPRYRSRFYKISLRYQWIEAKFLKFF